MNYIPWKTSALAATEISSRRWSWILEAKQSELRYNYITHNVLATNLNQALDLRLSAELEAS